MLQDHFYAATQTECTPLITLAALQVALKLEGRGATRCGYYSPSTIVQSFGFGQKQFTQAEVNQAELRLSAGLGFRMDYPSTIEMAEILIEVIKSECKMLDRAVLTQAVHGSLRLALLDIDLYYKFPHAALAAGSVLAALQSSPDPELKARAMLMRVLALACSSGEDSSETRLASDSVKDGKMAVDPLASSGAMPWSEVIQEVPSSEPAAWIDPAEAKDIVHEQWASGIEKRVADTGAWTSPAQETAQQEVEDEPEASLAPNVLQQKPLGDEEQAEKEQVAQEEGSQARDVHEGEEDNMWDKEQQEQKEEESKEPVEDGNEAKGVPIASEAQAQFSDDASSWCWCSDGKRSSNGKFDASEGLPDHDANSDAASSTAEWVKLRHSLVCGSGGLLHS